MPNITFAVTPTRFRISRGTVCYIVEGKGTPITQLILSSDFGPKAVSQMDNQRSLYSTPGDDDATLHGEGDAKLDLYRVGCNGSLPQAVGGLNSALGNSFNSIPRLLQGVNGTLAYPGSSARRFRARHLDGRDQHDFITESQFGQLAAHIKRWYGIRMPRLED